MRMYFLRDVKASFAPGEMFKKGGVYDISLNNVPTMLENKFAIPETLLQDQPKTVISIKKPKPGRPKRK